jgi:dihydroxyacetone kinase-like protein
MVMKKFMNDSENLVSELLEGYVLAYPDIVKFAGDNLIVRTIPKDPGKVGIVTLGGSGHEPGLSGFVGKGMLDVSIPGEIFAAPGPKRCLEALKIADQGAGVLFVVLNHAGDLMTANLTMELAQKEGLKVEMALVHEDIASGPPERPEERRGLIGFFPIFKIAGAAAEKGKTLEEISIIATALGNDMRSIAVALNPGTHPCTGGAMFTLGADEMGIGVGQHGEAGIERIKMLSADGTAQLLLSRLLEDMGVKQGEELLVILNGSGSTTMMELFIIFRRVHQLLEEKGIKIVNSLVGEFITTQEQAGFQLFIARVNKEMLYLWKAPCNTPYLTVQ